VLQRRLAFDLTGLPPEKAKSSNLKDEISSLLNSPHYGERWARHWLDLARYVDQTPDWLDSTKYSYLYRDWVVQALNEDMPYDRFVVRQLATDFLPECGPQDRVALGFIGLSPTYFKELQLPPEIIKTTVADEWEEHVDAIGRTFLGLTLACARCHDHKSDPITAQDYYALAGVFASVKLSEMPIVGDELWKPVEKARGEVAALEKQIKELVKKKPKDLKEQTASMQSKIAAIKTATPHYSMEMANAVEEAALFVVNKEKEHGTKLDYKMGMARDLELMKRGNPNDLGESVPRRFLSAFPVQDRPAAQIQHRQRSSRTGAGHRGGRSAAHCSRDRESRVEASLRSRFGRYAERVRQSRRSADASRAARRSRRSLHGARLVAEVAASRDFELSDVAAEQRGRRIREARSREQALCPHDAPSS
jgi:hypothetical protein